MQVWEKRARDEVAASFHQDFLVLRDSLPLYLNQLVDELSNRIDRTSARIEADEVESTRIGKKHGHERVECDTSHNSQRWQTDTVLSPTPLNTYLGFRI